MKPLVPILLLLLLNAPCFTQSEADRFTEDPDSTSALIIISKERINYTEKDRKTGKARLIVKERGSRMLYKYMPGLSSFKCTGFNNRMKHAVFIGKQVLDSSSVIQPIDCERRFSTGDCISLLHMFEFSNDTLKASDFPIDEKWLAKNINKASIMRVANKRGAGWQFEGKYTSKEQKERIFKGYADMDSIDVFLKDFPKTLSGDRSRNHSFRFIINYIQNADTLTYWRTNFNFNNPWMNDRGIAVSLNPYINQNLLNILPKEFIGRSNLLPDQFKWTYITWILKRNKYIGN